ncbi:MAG: protein-L-isoaspartate(D-aspartate) O-methyltransferase [Pseudomonadota bacterium]
MTGKGKNFPLTLSAVVDKSASSSAHNPAKKNYSSAFDKLVATPQTATRNAANNAANKVGVPQFSAARNASPSKTFTNAAAREAQRENQAARVLDAERANPLVSDAIRRAMVGRIAKQGVKDATVLAAMDAVPRHLFMEPALASQAYIDASLPIGHHQTISQPYIVARMIELLRNGAAMNNVLEIGTGCGYQAAVLSCLAQQVYSIERIKALHELAKNNLRPMRIPNIRLHYGDGMLGLPQAAPFDGIILAAAGLDVPAALLQQLTIGGRLVAPVGTGQQVLQLIERAGQSSWSRVTLENCHFVPLRNGVV